MAVLGLVIEEPRDAPCTAQCLSTRFRAARFAPSTAHMTLPRLEAQGFVRRVDGGMADELSQDRYEATAEGVEHFRRWLGSAREALPALRDALHARIDMARPIDLERVIEITDYERRACEREYASACGRLAEARQVVRMEEEDADWSARVREVVTADEAMIWAYRSARLKRLRGLLEDLNGRFGEYADEPEPQLTS